MKREDRIERIRDRHLTRAVKAKRQAEHNFGQANGLAKLMNGEPIHVGHHSEKRHRRDINRMDSAMRSGIAADKVARESAAAADNVDNAGISIQDSDATELLAEKLEGLEKKQAHMKAVNRIIRRKPKNVMTLPKLSLLSKELAAFYGRPVKESTAAGLFEPDFCGRIGFPPYALSNNNANIKRCERRLAELERLAKIQDDEEIAAGTCEGHSFRFVTDTDDMRVRFESPRLSREANKLLKRNGFKWSPNRGVWIRLLNQRAIETARNWLAPELEKLS